MAISDFTSQNGRARTLAEWQSSLQDRPWLRYAGALAMAAMALLIRYWVDRTLGTKVPFGISVVAVTLSAFFFGPGPSILTTIVTVTIGLYLIGKPPANPGESALQAISVAVFVLNGIAVATAAGLLQKTLRSRQEAERNLELALRREKMARASAERAFEARTKLMSRVSHELRTPLAPAHMIVKEALSAGDESTISRDDLEIILRSISAELQLADELLDHAQLGAGKVRLNIKPVRAVDAVRQAIDSCVAMNNWHGPVPEFRAGLDERAEINVDPLRFQQIVCNLLRNAGKFTPAHGAIVVETQTSGDSLAVRVKDTGIGIDESRLPQIFEEFNQGDHDRGRYGGMGLGLAIAQSLAKLHGGHIYARSDGVGKGSEFVLELPLGTSRTDTPGCN